MEEVAPSLFSYLYLSFFSGEGEGQRIGIIDLSFHLVYIPVGIKKHQVNHADIGTYPFYFLDVPQGESIVIAVGKKNSIFLTGIEIIICQVTGGIAS